MTLLKKIIIKILNLKLAILLEYLNIKIKANFSKPNYLGANIKKELDLSDYATRTDLKNTTVVDTSSFAKKTDLANLKSDLDKLDIYKLK